MQLDLFEDNRPGILMNMVNEHLMAQKFEKALSVCEEVLQDYPENLYAAELKGSIQKWHFAISTIEPSSCNPEQLREMRENLDSEPQSALRTAVLKVIVNLLETLPEYDHVFFPPRFHRGHLLLELQRYSAAITSFRTSLTFPDIEKGRFLAWSADAMTLAGKADDAVMVYQQALLEDPATVDIDFIRHQGIQKLRLHCHQEADGIGEEGEAPWLPVWGWMQGVFPLPLHNPPVFDDLESVMNNLDLVIPRIWFDLLTLAEYLRTVERDDRRMASVRRKMKQLNEGMFESYMLRIRGTGQ